MIFYRIKTVLCAMMIFSGFVLPLSAGEKQDPGLKEISIDEAVAMALAGNSEVPYCHETGGTGKGKTPAVYGALFFGTVVTGIGDTAEGRKRFHEPFGRAV